MKKCASCTKDLPDAALHCVFCGAKQPPAPATAGGVAKTVLGSYSANDVIDHIRNQPPAPQPRPSPHPMPAAQPFPSAAPHRPNPPTPAVTPGYHGGAPMPAVPPASVAPTMFVPGPSGPHPGPGPGPMNPNLGLQPTQMARPSAPVASPSGPTIMAPPGPPNLMGPGPMGPGPMGPGPMGPGPMGPPMGHGAMPPQPMAPQPLQPGPVPMHQYHPPSQPPPFAHINTAARIGRPIEPWKDALRVMMFIFGGALLIAFAVPLTIDPLTWSWDKIINGQGTAKLPPLIMASVGLLSIAIAAIPTSPAPRGVFAAMLGLTGVLVPLFLPATPDWQVMAALGGLFILLPGLLLRTEYRESIAPRILITIGVLACLAMYLVPDHGEVPLVGIFKGMIDAPGKAKIEPILHVAYITILVLTLLAWMPSPSTGGANVFMWVLVAWPFLLVVVDGILTEKIGPMISKTPGVFLTVAVAGAGPALGAAYAVLIAYGIATLVAKKLE